MRRPNAPGKPALEHIFQNAITGRMHVNIETKSITSISMGPGNINAIISILIIYLLFRLYNNDYTVYIQRETIFVARIRLRRTSLVKRISLKNQKSKFSTCSPSFRPFRLIIPTSGIECKGKTPFDPMLLRPGDRHPPFGFRYPVLFWEVSIPKLRFPLGDAFRRRLALIGRVEFLDGFDI